MIDLTVDPKNLERAVQRVRERGILIPTFAQLRNPDLIPAGVKKSLTSIGLWDLHPLNLFRITWKNEPVPSGGGYGSPNYLVLPSELTGVPARIVVMTGKWFPTGAHKVGAAFGCLVPRLVAGQFDPVSGRAAWPSTGNYCRGGAYDSALLGCQSIAILPKGMSRERFEWLEKVAGEVIRTPGSESNVKEIFDVCRELRKQPDVTIFNQFDDFGNYLWHYGVTGPAMEEALLALATGPRQSRHIRGLVAGTGSGGTLAAGDYLKSRFPWLKVGVMESLQCPTLMENGHGDHRIEGIGDKHVPWIHNIKNTDAIIGLDDHKALTGMRLLNEKAGRDLLAAQGLAPEVLARLDLLGISGVANVQAAIKFAKYYELGSDDLVVTVATDSVELYHSRLEELEQAHGPFGLVEAAVAFESCFAGQNTANVKELTWPERRRIHNLKYYTWVEQQGKKRADLMTQWQDDAWWEQAPLFIEQIDALIKAFNERTGVTAA